jgi:hypothetical protein
MPDRLPAFLLLAGLSLLCRQLPAADYHVDPHGDDAHDGLSPRTAWRTVAKVNATAFMPGDRILFARGGAWHEALSASSSGAAGRPIVYDAYGSGEKPVFWGSDEIAADAWHALAAGRYRCQLNAPAVTQLLADHGTGAHGQWFAAGSGVGTFQYEAGQLTLESASDPRSDGRIYAAVTRQDVVSSHGKDHLEFRNLHGEETADPANGYVFRVMGSQDVLLEDCEAYRGGRHDFGVINSTGFIGRRLHAAYAIPKQATLYVSYSGDESAFSDCTSQWIDCSADHFEDGSIFFVCHGRKLGQLTFINPIDHGGKISILEDSPGQRVRISGGLVEDGSIELICAHAVVEGVTFSGSAAVDCYGHDNVLQNLKMLIKPERGGPTGYGTAILMRKGARGNTVRFCSVLMDPAAGADKSCLMLLERALGTSWYGNILVGGVAVGGVELGGEDASGCDCNLYGQAATIGGLDLERWQALGIADRHSLVGDPRFTAPEKGDLTLRAGSPALNAATLPAQATIGLDTDFAGRPRPRSGAFTIGAFEGAGR